MKLQSLVSQGWELVPIEVEVLLQRGLPELKFVGLPDQAIRESAIRIKTALKQSGFRWPEAEQIIVNLKPNHLKKSSRGLELAVAAAIVWESQQRPTPELVQRWTFYGELNLDGSVLQPEDLSWAHDQAHFFCITGQCTVNSHRPWLQNPIGRLSHISQLNEPTWENNPWTPQCAPPPELNLWLTQQQADLALLAAYGRHSVLMGGPAGSGKSLMGEVIHSFSEEPDAPTFKELWRRRLQSPEFESSAPLWRPLIRPHHSTTLNGLIGGGSPIRPGELARAHHGTLILDELLEFKPQVIEALREPLETGKVRIARVSGYQTYDCQVHLIATTNLCPCGDYVPKTPTSCRYSLTRCRSYSQKLTGPLVDRFQILTYSHRWKGPRTVSSADLSLQLQEVRAQKAGGALPNSQLQEDYFNIAQWPLLERKLLEQLKGSHRRYLSTLRVAQTLANLKGKSQPRIHELEEALRYTVTPFVDLQRWD